MDLKEAIEKAIIYYYRVSIEKNDGYVFIELLGKTDEEIEVVMVEATAAISFLEKWEQGIYDFGGINFAPSIPRVQYIKK